MTEASSKVVWKIKKEDFEKGDFGDCNFQLGKFQWAIGFSSFRMNLRQDEPAYFRIDWNSAVFSSTTFFNVNHKGSFTLLGFNEKHNAVDEWCTDALGPDAFFTCLTIDNSVLSFDEKYLFPDGTYHLEFQVAVKDLSVDFGSPNHELLLSDADTGCLQIDEQKLYLSKSYLSAISPYFKMLFFGDFKREIDEVVVLSEVKGEDFMEFLAHSYTIFSSHRKVYRVGAALELADKYQCKSVFASCKDLLEKRNGFDLDDLKLSKKYKFVNICKEAVATLPVGKLKEYLTEIMSDPDSEYVRRLITKRFEDEAHKRKRLEDGANKRKRVCTCSGEESEEPEAKR